MKNLERIENIQKELRSLHEKRKSLLAEIEKKVQELYQEYWNERNSNTFED